MRRLYAVLILLLAAPAVAQHSGTVVGSPTFGAAKFGNGLTAVSDSNYISTPSGTLPSGTTLAVEAQIKTSSTSGVYELFFACGTSSVALWLGMLPNAHFGIAGGAGISVTDSGITINDGIAHVVALSINGGTARLFVDGTLGATAAGYSGLSTTSCYIGRNTGTGNPWLGTYIDEVVIWPTARYTASYTPATSAYVGNEGMTELYHLQADGTDSAGSTASFTASPSLLPVGTSGNTVTLTGTGTSWTTGTPGSPTFTLSGGTGASITAQSVASATSATLTITAGSTTGPLTISDPSSSTTATITVGIGPNNSAIIYSPFNWNVTSTFAGAVNAGAYFYTIFSGTSATLKFDLTGLSTPYAQMWCQVDNDVVTRYTIAATVAVAASLDSRKHLLRCVAKSSLTTNDRWNAPVWKLTGLALDTSATVTQPVRRTKNILCYGDSITEGVYALGTSGTSADFDDAMGTWCYALAQAMDAEVGIVGFSGSGVSVAGSGNAPALPSSYNLIYSGVSRSFTSPAPDLVIYDHGTNDGTTNIQSAYTTIVNAIKTAAPSAKQLLLCPFGSTYCSNQSTNIQAVATATGATFVSTTGWFNSADSNDGTHPYGYSAVTLIAPKLFPYVAAALYPSAGRSYSFF